MAPENENGLPGHTRKAVWKKLQAFSGCSFSDRSAAAIRLGNRMDAELRAHIARTRSGAFERHLDLDPFHRSLIDLHLVTSGNNRVLGSAAVYGTELPTVKPVRLDFLYPVTHC